MSDMKHILAKDVILRAKKGDGLYYVFACVNQVDLQLTGELIEVVTAESGNWKDFVYAKLMAWTVALSGVCVLDDVVNDAWTLEQIADIPMQFTELEIELTFTDVAGTGTTWSGTVLMPDFAISAGMNSGGEPAMWNVQLQGKGALTKAAAPELFMLIEDEDEGKILLE